MATIAVIDDDMAMRTLTCEWLVDAGYVVRGVPLGSSDADDAPDLVIVSIPNLRAAGADALREVRATYPRSALIGLSTQLARSLGPDSALVRSLGLRRLVAKPFAREELTGAVADAIGPAA